MSLANKIVEAIKKTIGKKIVVLHEPRFYWKESEYVQECINSKYVSSVVKFVDIFENELSIYTGAKYTVAVVNGTEALHVSLLLAGIKSGDEVLVPALTFVETANAVRYCGANPLFVDIEERTLGIDPKALRKFLKNTTEFQSGHYVNRITGRPIRAIIMVHIFGHPCDIEGLAAVARDFNLVLIEDAAESLGSTYHGKHTGTFGLLGTLSFNGNKIITTGGGGAILTDDQELAKRAKHLTTTAKLSHGWEYYHDEVGFNFRMPNLNAALGCAQLEKLPKFLSSKRQLFERYEDAFMNISEVQLFKEPKNSRSNYWLQTLLLEESVADQREEILKKSNNEGFMTRPAWVLLHKLPPYENCPRASLKVAEALARRIINLPSSAGLL